MSGPTDFALKFTDDLAAAYKPPYVICAQNLKYPISPIALD